MKVGVVVFPGSNCDRDMFHVLTDVFHLDAQYYWHEKNLPKNIDAVVLPGGFSYGDRLRAGVIAAHSPIIKDVQKLAKKGIPILGVCNGFQILVEADLLPGVLLKNNSLNCMCQWTTLVVENNTSFAGRALAMGPGGRPPGGADDRRTHGIEPRPAADTIPRRFTGHRKIGAPGLSDDARGLG